MQLHMASLHSHPQRRRPTGMHGLDTHACSRQPAVTVEMHRTVFCEVSASYCSGLVVLHSFGDRQAVHCTFRMGH